MLLTTKQKRTFTQYHYISYIYLLQEGKKHLQMKAQPQETSSNEGTTPREADRNGH